MPTDHILVTAASSGPDWFSASVAFGSAIAGAIAGAVPAFILAKHSAQDVLTRDREERRERERMLALRAHVKLGTILNSVAVLRRHIAQALANPPVAGAEAWQAVEPIVGGGREYQIDFEVEEMAVLLAANQGDLAGRLSLLARRHSVHGETLKEYAERKHELRRSLPPPIAVEGKTGTNELTREQYLALRPQMVALNSIIEQLQTFLVTDLAMGIGIADELTPALKAYFKTEDIPAFTIDDGLRAEVAHITLK